jgi:hypothetical protein
MRALVSPTAHGEYGADAVLGRLSEFGLKNGTIANVRLSPQRNSNAPRATWPWCGLRLGEISKLSACALVLATMFDEYALLPTLSVSLTSSLRREPPPCDDRSSSAEKQARLGVGGSCVARGMHRLVPIC